MVKSSDRTRWQTRAVSVTHADAHEQARWFGDDIAFKADMYDVNFAGLPMMAFMLRHLGAGEAPL